MIQGPSINSYHGPSLARSTALVYKNVVYPTDLSVDVKSGE